MWSKGGQHFHRQVGCGLRGVSTSIDKWGVVQGGSALPQTSGVWSKGGQHFHRQVGCGLRGVGTSIDKWGVV